MDVVDESDVQLSPSFQLVYSCGKTQQLPGLQERCAAAQALVQAVSALVRVPDSTLHAPGVAVWAAEGGRCAVVLKFCDKCVGG